MTIGTFPYVFKRKISNFDIELRAWKSHFMTKRVSFDKYIDLPSVSVRKTMTNITLKMEFLKFTLTFLLLFGFFNLITTLYGIEIFSFS